MWNRLPNLKMCCLMEHAFASPSAAAAAKSEAMHYYQCYTVQEVSIINRLLLHIFSTDFFTNHENITNTQTNIMSPCRWFHLCQ